MGKILIEQSEWDEVRALATNIIVHGGEARRFGTGKHARWALSFGLRPGSGGGKTEIAAGTVSSGSGLIYDVALINPLTGETLESSSAKAMPLQLNYFYTIPAGTKVVVIPLDVNTTGDGSGV